MATNPPLRTDRKQWQAPDPERDNVWLTPAGKAAVEIANGTKATAIDDADPKGKGPGRLLKIRIAEGPHADAVATIERDFIRPAP